jgi:hypothetical protein
MQALIKHCSKYDVEIIDNEIYIYSQQSLNYKEDYAKFINILDELSLEFNENAKHYRDDRVVAFGASADVRSNTISKDGKRLKKSLKPVLIVAGLYLLLSIGRLVIESQGYIFGQFAVVAVFIIGSLIYGIIKKLRS